MALLMVSALVLTFLIAPVHGEGFLAGQSRHAASLRSEDLQAAVVSVLGHGSDQNRSAITQALQPIWQAMPKNRYDNIEWRQLRYLTHRYFMQTKSFMIRGLEPMHEVSESNRGSAKILSQNAPALAETLLHGHRAEYGFSLEDATSLTAALEQLTFDSETELLEKVYRHERFMSSEYLSRNELQRLVRAYVIFWMLGEDESSASVLAKNASLTEELLPNWKLIESMAHGTVQGMEYSRQRSPKLGDARVAWKDQYTFKDAHEVVGNIAQNFASFWENQCQQIKTDLIKLDKTGTGRVRLADFYGANLDGEWRFGESEAYLRELGALDESSSWRGKQVVIPNYLQGASNCIVSRPNYLVCCINECEDILGEVEAAAGAPVAELTAIMALIANMSGYDDIPVKLDTSQRAQLTRIAETHGGMVPLHGRLFAQWLHYVFPRECPFPHKIGASTASTPTEFGENYVASKEEVTKHAKDAKSVQQPVTGELGEGEDVQWMSQWSEEEELLTDYSKHLRAPWELPFGLRGLAAGFGGAGAVFVAMLWASGTIALPTKSGDFQGFDQYSKSHFV